MADIALTQAEADILIAMEKHRVDEKELDFLVPGERVTIPLASLDRREYFLLDATRSQIEVKKATYQNPSRQVIVLMRLDIAGSPHRNPDGEEVPCPHLHVYREGYGDKWAIPAPVDRYPETSSLFATFEEFMRHCNITLPPPFRVGLF